jgi:hypothetical protein
MTLYQYLFYRIYKRQRTKNGETESTLVSIMAITCILFLNLITIETFVNKLFSTPITINSTVAVVVLMASIFGLNCFIFLFKKKYKDIEQRFSNETTSRNNWGTFGIITYIVFSFILFFISVNFK